MPSRLHTDDDAHNEIQQMDRRLPDQRVSSHMERKPVKPGKAVENNVDDVVKYMSNVPSYLQRLEKGDDVQEKALNFGVLDWGRLEKWAYLRKQVDADRRGGSSPSSSNSSSSSDSLSTFVSSSKSYKNHSVQRVQDTAQNKAKSHISRSKEVKFHNCEPEGFSGGLKFTKDWLQDQCSVVEGVWDHLQECEHEICVSHDSAILNDEKAVEANRKNFSVSCPLPSTNMKLGQFMEGLSTKPSVIVKSGEGKAKVSSATCRPHRMLNAGLNMIRNSTSGEGSLGRQTNQKTVLGNSRVENSTFLGESRRSSSPHCQKEVISMKQGLLKLIWKNELPLFVFSANDHDILAATVGNGSMSRTNDFSYDYIMFTSYEIKKKGGLWMGRRNKRKNHDLICNVVGQMRVSSSKSTSSCPNDSGIMREFVLRGSELAPTAHGCDTPPFDSELAAIVIKVPTERPETQRSMQNLYISQTNESSGLANVTAILPNGIHGISSKGNPSPLMERWKSGGSCDCGGWDEGCILTVLTNRIQESRSVDSSQACLADGTHRIELLPLGEDRENRHTFRIVLLKEGVYAVEFGASIALVQAFAVCIAILHSENPRALSRHHYSMKAQSTASEKHPASYVPIHPPLSPAGRA